MQVKDNKIDPKECFVCKKHITDDREFVCAECYNKSLKELENNELYKKIKDKDIYNSEWFSALVVIFAIFGNKGEKK